MKEAGTHPYFDDSVTLPLGRGYGISQGNFDEGPRPGTNENSFGWRDITAEVSTRGVLATDPTFTQVGSTAFRFYRFATGKYVWFNYHVPHDLYVPPSGNASVFFHVHWFTDDAATGLVTWQWTYAYAKGFNQEAFDFSLANSPQTTAKVITVQQASGGAFKHMVAETVEVEIPGLTEPDGIICVQLARIASTTSPLNELSSNPFMITADLHYRTTNIGTPQKAPDSTRAMTDHADCHETIRRAWLQHAADWDTVGPAAGNHARPAAVGGGEALRMQGRSAAGRSENGK